MTPAIVLTLLFALPAAAQYNIRTLAGGGPPDGTPATSVAVPTTFRYISYVAVDAGGNLYMTTSLKLLKVSPDGLVRTIAGNGALGIPRDGSLALNTPLGDVAAIAVDNRGNIFIGDQVDRKIRKITSDGYMSTFADRQQDPFVLATDSAGNLYTSPAGYIVRFAPDGTSTVIAGNGTLGFSGDGGPALQAAFNTVVGIAVDALGNVFVADSHNQRVRKISKNGIVTTIAGTVVIGSTGDGGPATNAALNFPQGVAVDAAGNVYISDQSSRIRKVNTAGIITTIAGNGTTGYSGDGGPAVAATLFFATMLATDSSGALYFPDLNNNRIRKIVPAGIITTVAGNGDLVSGDGGRARNAQVSLSALAYDRREGILYLAEGNRIRKLSPAGIITTVAGTAVPGDSGDGVAASAQLNGPLGLAVDSAGTLFVADSYNGSIRKLSNGVITRVAGKNENIGFPVAVAVDKAGNLYISDQQSNKIRKMTSDGIIRTIAGNGTSGYSGDGGPALSASLNRPAGLALDLQGNLYINDVANYRIRKLSPEGIITTAAGNGTAGYSGDGGPAANAQIAPSDLAVDESGDLWITNELHVRKVSGGIITTVAGNGNSDFSGDGGLALDASLSNAGPIAIGANGSVFIGDASWVRVLDPVFSVQPRSLAFTALAHGVPPPAQTLTVTGAASNLAATVTAGADWLSVGSLGIGTYSAWVRTQVLDAGSYGGNVRLTSTTATVDVPVTLTVTSACVTGLQPLTATVAAAGGTTSFSVLASSGCSWTATSDVSWMIIASGGTGTGGGSVIVQVLANGGATRSGTISVGLAALFTVAQPAPSGTSTGYYFIPVTPCRIADTRLSTRLAAGQTRSFSPQLSSCAIAANAAAYSLNLTVVPAGPLTYVAMWPAGVARPLVSTLNSFDGRIKANAAIVPAGTAGAVNVFATDTTDVVLDINGYFVTPAAGGSSFYPVSPCRVSDTRTAGGPLQAGETRVIQVLASNCGIPFVAQAFSLNFTAVPPGPLGYLAAWPASVAPPLVSTLNALSGTVTANAAIVPAGYAGWLDVFATNVTDVVTDINGYFGPPGGSGALSFHPVVPCRISDTRLANGTFGGPMLAAGESRSYPIPSSSCGIPATARAYSLNVTVVPQRTLSYLTLWPSDVAQPLVSTLNSFDGSVVSNAAIVPGSAGGAIRAYVTNPAHLILDINGYFQ